MELAEILNYSLGVLVYNDLLWMAKMDYNDWALGGLEILWIVQNLGQISSFLSLLFPLENI